MTNVTESHEETFKPNAIALTIAGSDCSGGAGLQADLKTFQQLGVYGASAVTMITVQNTQKIAHIEYLSPKIVVDQIDAVVTDLSPIIAKTGALGNAAIINAVAEKASEFPFPLIVDPVMVSKNGESLIEPDAVDAYKSLMKHAFLVTPNRRELSKLTGIDLKDEDSVAHAIHDLHQMGARYVLVKMGESNGSSEHIFGDGNENTGIITNRFDIPHTHGAGCVLSAAITALMALGDDDIMSVCKEAIELVLIGIYNAHPIGQGISPVETRVL